MPSSHELKDGDHLPQESTVLRHCKKNFVIRDDDGKPLSVSKDAIFLREDQETGLPKEEGVSVNWIEYFEGNMEEMILGARKAIPLKIHKKDCFAILQTSKILEASAEFGYEGNVLYKPKSDNKSHSEIHDIGLNDGPSDLYDTIVAEMLALYSTVDLPHED